MQWKTPVTTSFRANNFFGASQAGRKGRINRKNIKTGIRKTKLLSFQPRQEIYRHLLGMCAHQSKAGLLRLTVSLISTISTISTMPILYAIFRCEPLWLNPKEVNAHVPSQEVLQSRIFITLVHIFQVQCCSEQWET